MKSKAPKRSKTPKTSKAPKTSKTPYLFAALTALFVGLMLYLVNFTDLKDYVLAAAYHPSTIASSVEEKLDLTVSGTRIFRASQPELHHGDFSSYCDSLDPSRSVLGCYSDRRIHIYYIDSQELAGIVESTAAHELMHAIWERLSGHEKDELLNSLNQVYQSNYDELKIVADYPETSQASELYARVATEITDLPPELETHYAQYFKNRAEIVDFYRSYATVFSELSSALRLILTEINDLEPQINEQKTAYETRSANLSQKITDFNACAQQSGCFSAATFNAERQNLLAEQSALAALYDDLSSKINRYNELVEAYNANLLHERELVKIVNSNQEGENHE